MNIKIDPKSLSDTALNNLLNEFILKEGTDYGWNELSLTQKRIRLNKLIESGKAVIVFDDGAQTCNIINKEEYIA